MKQARDNIDLYEVIHLITQGHQVEEKKSAWQLIELKEQFKLLKSKEGVKLAHWKAKFNQTRLKKRYG